MRFDNYVVIGYIVIENQKHDPKIYIAQIVISIK